MGIDETASGLTGLTESREETDTNSWNTSDTGSIIDVSKGQHVVYPQEGVTVGKIFRRGLLAFTIWNKSFW